MRIAPHTTARTDRVREHEAVEGASAGLPVVGELP
ncbi:hypothetical protein SALBM135S_05816 [Streptomyces alboniger]